MDHDDPTDGLVLKLISIVLAISGLIGFFKLLGDRVLPSQEDLAFIEQERQQWKETMEARQRMEEQYWQSRPTAAEIEAALNPPDGW